MKKKVSLAIGLLSFASLVTSCSNKTTINWKDYRLENVGDYTAFGCGSLSNKSTDTKGKKARLNKDKDNDFVKAEPLIHNEGNMDDYYIVDSSPITLIGLSNGEVNELEFNNGESFKNITINRYQEFSDFIYFTYFDVEKYYGKNPTNVSYECDLRSSIDPIYDGDLARDDSICLSYLLSKKTGNIYQYTYDSPILGVFCGGGITYVRSAIMTNSETSEYASGKLFKLVEENEKLQFIETKIPEQYVTEPVDASKQINPGIDKYGNLLTSKGIINTDMKINKFSSYFDGGTFDLNSQKEIVHFSKDSLKVCVLNSEGNFIEDENALKGLIFEKTGFRYGDDDGLFKDLSKEQFLEKINELGYASSYDCLTYDEFDNVIGYCIKKLTEKIITH